MTKVKAVATLLLYCKIKKASFDKLVYSNSATKDKLAKLTDKIIAGRPYCSKA